MTFKMPAGHVPKAITFFSMGCTLFVHKADQMMDPEMSGIYVAERFNDVPETHVISANFEIVKNINTPNKPCLVKENKFDQELKKLLVEKMMKEVGCITPFTPHHGSEEARVCTNAISGKAANNIYMNLVDNELLMNRTEVTL